LRRPHEDSRAGDAARWSALFTLRPTAHGPHPTTALSRRAFTLIELTAVLAIIAIILGIVAVSLRAPYQRARLQEAVERMAFADRQMRSHARGHFHPCQLAIDLDRSALEIIDSRERDAPRRAFTLGGGIRIGHVVSGTGSVEQGDTHIACSSNGLTETYAIRLQGAGRTQHWLLFAGVTGQMTEMNDEEEVLSLFDHLLGVGGSAEGL
jgi:prepilin-type N-terminal cleavage/methylation domain-containing protein